MEKENLNNIFERKEQKYLLSKQQYRYLREALLLYMQIDQYGLHTICNIYYDTENYELARRSIEKPVYKEKFRIRSYGIPSLEDIVFLELKKKWEGTVYKRRIGMKLKEAIYYLKDNTKVKDKGQILEEIDYFFKFYQPEPKVFLAYDRIAMFGKENSQIRITFDQNIRVRQNNLDLTKGDNGEKLLEKEQYLMEIKVPGAQPLWLVNLLSEFCIYPNSFSKYGVFYKNRIVKEGDDSLCLQVS